MEEQLKKLRSLLNDGLITNEEYNSLRNNILSGEKSLNKEILGEQATDKSNVDKLSSTSQFNWKILIAVGITAIVAILAVSILIIHNNKLNDKRDLAQQITNDTNYTVKYVASRDAFECFASGDWQTELTNNVEEYASNDEVSTSFIKDWRSTVITSIQARSQERQGKGSRFEIMNPENEKKTLLVIKDGKVVEDTFSDITYDYNN
ncbi:SHOCT domain-containing protein [Leuconostoc gelidum]|uniref:SHOCT domain-containing protein n=1 Tax=Leuconostoc gelidum subsp. gelidum TaxID=1607839 RepID=A0AB35FZC4_LEUGE|nr:SHOCT domain-containing protein [Leuconostoc gelidum]MBZ6016002.1 SHOCT domain-containing protein [Leuconostoc gelidum subsp. gelidum]